MQEKRFFWNNYGESLCSVYETDNYKKTILFLHGFCGGKEENGLFDLASYLFSVNEYDTFRFDHSGLGESHGSYINSSLRKQSSEYKSALDYILEKNPETKIGVVAFSLGATVALKNLDERVNSYSFWSPAFFPNKDICPKYCNEELLNQARSQGYFRKDNYLVAVKLLEELKNFSSEISLSQIKVPVQIIHGTGDQRISWKSSFKAAHLLNVENETYFPSAGHSFKDGSSRTKVIVKSLEWFNKNM